MTTSRFGAAIVTLIAALTIACTAAPQAGGGGTATPTASATSSPAPSATAQPSPTPTAAPPAAVFATTSAGPQSFVGCYTLHLARPEIQTEPPFKPIAIQSAQLSAAASPAAARSALATTCGSANANPLPWGAPGAGIDAAHYVDDRNAGETVITSYYNAINRKEYSRAYGYWEPGSPQRAAFATFSAGYANT